MGKYYDDGGFFSVGYTVENLTFNYSSWDDQVGRSFCRSAQSVPGDFNTAHEDIWEKIGPLLTVREDAIEYDSKRDQIERLIIDE